MKAHNLTISIPVKEGMARCDKNCPYCISNMTVSVKDNERLMIRNADKVKRLALAAGATSVLLTGKGEPLLNYGSVVNFAQKFKEFPLEIQTNGKFLAENIDAIAELHRIGVDTFAISIDQLSDLYEFARLITYIQKSNSMIRICVNVINHAYTFEEIAREAYTLGVNQLLFRKIMKPDVLADTEISKMSSSWINSRVEKYAYHLLYHEFMSIIDPQKDIIRILPHGPVVYVYRESMSVLFSDYCIQENNNTEDIRSLIFLSNGHLYTSWDKRASMIF